ncbi:hypothetical protein D3C76_899000 [compost metagenome]
MQVRQQGFQRLALRLMACFVLQVEAVEGIQEQARIALLTQLRGALEDPLAPGGRREIHDLAIPCVVAHIARGGTQSLPGYGCGIAIEFADRQVGERRAALRLQVGHILGRRMLGFEHHPVELCQFRQRWFLGVPEGHTGRLAGRSRSGGRKQSNSQAGEPCRPPESDRAHRVLSSSRFCNPPASLGQFYPHLAPLIVRKTMKAGSPLPTSISFVVAVQIKRPQPRNVKLMTVKLVKHIKSQNYDAIDAANISFGNTSLEEKTDFLINR